MKFVDEATIRIEAGNGGRGHVSFRREMKVPDSSGSVTDPLLKIRTVCSLFNHGLLSICSELIVGPRFCGCLQVPSKFFKLT